MRAKHLMSQPAISVQSDATIDQAVQIMLDQHISGLPVLDKKGRLVGMLTEADLLRRGELGTGKRHPRWLQFFMSPGRLADEYTHEHGRKVEEVMTAEVVTATESTSLQELVDLMSKHEIKRVPVVRDGALVGIVSRADVLRTLSKVFQAQASYGIRSDAEIRRDVEAELKRAECFRAELIEVSVEDGDVTLHGCITDERERSAVRVALENVPGVQAIHDHLTWIDPMSGVTLLSSEDEAADRRASKIKAA